MLDTAEVIKVRGPHAVVSKTPDVGSLEKNVIDSASVGPGGEEAGLRLSTTDHT